MWPEPAVVIRAAIIAWVAFSVLLILAQALGGDPPDPDAVLA